MHILLGLYILQALHWHENGSGMEAVFILIGDPWAMKVLLMNGFLP
jgi:hypothetical protein